MDMEKIQKDLEKPIKIVNSLKLKKKVQKFDIFTEYVLYIFKTCIL